MTDIIVLLGAATFVAVIFHIVKLPPIVAFFAAGAIVGPYGLGWIQSPPQVEIMTEGAAILLMFTIGLEFSLKTFTQFRRPLLFLGAGQVLTSILVFFLIFLTVFQFPAEKALFFSFMMALSSTAVVLKLLSEHRDLETPHGKAGLSILLSQDIAVIPMIITIPFLYRINEMASSFMQSILPITIVALMVLSGLYFLNRFILPQALARVAQTKSREVFFFCLIFFVASISYFMHAIGLSMSLGAFIAGMLIAGSAYGKQATADFLPLRDAFLGLFFVTIGMLLDLSFLAQNIHWVVLLAIPLLAIKALIIFLVVWFAGNTGSVSRVSSLLLFQLGEFSFIVADQGMKMNLLSQTELQYFIAISIISLVLTPLVYRYMSVINNSQRLDNIAPTGFKNFAYKLREKYLKLISGDIDLHTLKTQSDHKPEVLIVGFGVAGKSLAKTLKAQAIPYTILEANSQTVQAYQNSEPIYFGDASSKEILEHIGIEHCKLACILTSGISTLEPVVRNLRSLRTDISILVRTNYFQDIDKIRDIPLCHIVVSEMEASLEVVQQSLIQLQIDSESIDECVEQTRNDLNERYNG